MANRKTSQLTEVTTLPDNAKIYAVDESRAIGDRSVQIDKSNLIPAGVESIIEGTNVTVDATDPANPIVSSTGADALPQPITTASTNYTLVEADIKAWTPYRFTGNDITITIPSITFEEFIVINMQHTGTGTVTIQSGAGVTFPDQTFTTDKAFSIASYADDVWDIYSLEIEQTAETATYSATSTAVTTLDCDTFDSRYQILTVNTDIQWSNTPASGQSFVKTIEVIGAFSLTFTTSTKVIGTYVDDGTTVNLITVNFAFYPTIGLRITVLISQ